MLGHHLHSIHAGEWVGGRGELVDTAIRTAKRIWNIGLRSGFLHHVANVQAAVISLRPGGSEIAHNAAVTFRGRRSHLVDTARHPRVVFILYRPETARHTRVVLIICFHAAHTLHTRHHAVTILCIQRTHLHNGLPVGEPKLLLLVLHDR